MPTDPTGEEPADEGSGPTGGPLDRLGEPVDCTSGSAVALVGSRILWLVTDGALDVFAAAAEGRPAGAARPGAVLFQSRFPRLGQDGDRRTSRSKSRLTPARDIPDAERLPAPLRLEPLA